VLAVLSAGFAVYVALAWRWVECAEDWSRCSAPGLVQLVIAGLGLLPALAMLVFAICGRGHPWRWLLGTALVYAAWGVFVSQVFIA
jgi:hypothetical protein